MHNPEAPTLTGKQVLEAQATTQSLPLPVVSPTKEFPIVSTVRPSWHKRILHAIVESVESWQFAKVASALLVFIGLMAAAYVGTLKFMPDALPDAIKPPILAEEAPRNKEEPSPDKSRAPRDRAPVQVVENFDAPTANKTAKDEGSASSTPDASSSPSATSSPSAPPSDAPTKEEDVLPSDMPTGNPDTTTPPPATPSEPPVTETPEETPPASPVVTPDIATPSAEETVVAIP